MMYTGHHKYDGRFGVLGLFGVREFSYFVGSSPRCDPLFARNEVQL